MSEFKPETAALILIDLQQAIVARDCAPHKSADVVKRGAELAAAMRAKGGLVIYVSVDLADFMTWKSTGSTARSRCTLTAKWNYLAHLEKGWQQDFLERIGLDDLQERGSLPDETAPVGQSVGRLTPEAAEAREAAVKERAKQAKKSGRDI